MLQYPDPRQGRTVAIATTRSPKALRSFKEAVLEEARLEAMGWDDLLGDYDEVLDLQDRLEIERLEKLFELVIPEEDGEDSR